MASYSPEPRKTSEEIALEAAEALSIALGSAFFTDPEKDQIDGVINFLTRRTPKGEEN